MVKKITKKPHLLMLIPNLGFGGAQRVFHDHGRLLAERFQVTGIPFNLDDGHAFPTGNPIVSLDVPGGGGPVAKVHNFITRVRRLAAIKRRLSAALTISHLEGADYVNVLARGPGKTMLVIHGSKLHDGNIRGPVGWIRRRILIPWLYDRADRIVTVSNAIRIELEAMGISPKRLCTIHNFFDPAAIRALSLDPLSIEETGLFGGPPVLVTSGRLVVQKNHAALIELFARLVKRRPARLVLIGEGELRQTLTFQARQLGLRVADGPGGDADIYFLGYQDNPFRIQRHASLFVLPSAWEGFPMVLGEAMACGLPIVSADCPTGPREFLAPDTLHPAARALDASEPAPHGILLPIPAIDDPITLDQWVETLSRLLDDPTERRRLADCSLHRAEDFCRDRIGPQWTAAVEELVASASRSA